MAAPMAIDIATLVPRWMAISAIDTLIVPKGSVPKKLHNQPQAKWMRKPNIVI